MRSAMSRSLRPLAPWYACPSSSLTALLNRSPGLAIPLTSTEESLGGGIPQPRNFVAPFSAKFCAGYYNTERLFSFRQAEGKNLPSTCVMLAGATLRSGPGGIAQAERKLKPKHFSTQAPCVTIQSLVT